MVKGERAEEGDGPFDVRVSKVEEGLVKRRRTTGQLHARELPSHRDQQHKTCILKGQEREGEERDERA